MHSSGTYISLKTSLLSAGILLLASCSNNKQSGVNEIASSHPAPQIVALNTQEGYSINPVTGDSIKPIINSLGDTVKTGIPVPARGKVIDPRSVGKPKVIPVGKPEVFPIPGKVHKIPDNLTVIPVDKSALKTFTPGVDTASLVLVNPAGDTIPTGVPIPATKNVVPCIQPIPVKAYPPIMKDNATMNIKYMDLNQGMNSSVIFTMYEDSRGNIWLGSEGRGVSVYNGETFTHFTENEGLTGMYARSILEDNLGNIWIATLGGVSIYNGQNFTHLTQNEGLIGNGVWSMIKDRQGNIWLGTFNGGVSMYNGETFTHFTQNEGLNDDMVFTILEDSKGNFWFGTRNGGVNRYDGETFTYFTENEGLGSNHVWAIHEDKLGNIWIGTHGGGVSMYDGKTFTNFTQNEGLLDNYIRSILEDSQGNLWFGTNDGVSMYNGDSFTHFTQNEGLSANTVLSMLEDSQGNIWFGTESGGVSIYYAKSFTHFPLAEYLSNIHVRSIMEDSRGRFWFGTWSKGVYLYDGETLTHFTEKEGLSANTIFAMLEDSHHNLWFGGPSGGVSMYNGKSFTHFTQNEGLSDSWVWAILEDSQGNIWIGTRNGGMSMYDGKTFTHFTEAEGLSDNGIGSILEDSDNKLWFSGEGVSMYDGKTFTHYTQREGLIHYNVRTMLEDSRGNLWFGTTDEGVSMYDGKTFTHFTRNDGLSDNCIESIVEDRNNNIWLATSYGLTRLTFSPQGVSDIQTYGLQDGLKSLEFNTRSVILDSRHRIWWGGIKGITVLETNDLVASPESPTVQLHSIDLNGKFTDYRRLDQRVEKKTKFNEVARFYNYPLNLELPYDYNHLTFHFVATDWSAPHRISYSYMLEGLDDNWSPPTSEAMAEYRNMSHGRYTFKVRAIGAGQKWSEPFTYTFRILPPLWLTWWAYMLYALILVLLLRWYRGYLILRQKTKANLRIKEAEVNKMQELDQMKSRFFANISHEFRTPLTLIQGPIEELRKQFQGDQERSIHLFQTVKRNTKRLQDLINQLLDISKLETGNVNLQVSQGDLAEYVKAIVLSFLSLAEYKKIRYEYDLPEEGNMVYFDPDKIEKIVTNLISNAFKFTSEGGNIRVDIQFFEASSTDTADSVEIKVSDTGKGIPEEMLGRIFDRFYRVSDSDTPDSEGTGLGLALTKELVDLYRGKIKVESKPGMGSTFTINLPVSFEQFRKGEIVRPSNDKEISIKTGTPDVEYEYYEETEIIQGQISDTPNGKPVILIIEDNEDLRKYISRNLENNYSVLFAENGKAGLNSTLINMPDLVICDVMMPVMDGIEMCKSLKTDERTDHIPVIMLTARADRDTKLEALETGADDYLVKPFDPEELQVRVKNLLEQRRRLRGKFRLEFLADTANMEVPSEDQFIKRLFNIFDQHISDPEFKINQLPSELNLSLSQIQRKVMAITGHTPGELLRNHRLKRAAIFFRSGHTHVAQVMYHVGFNNQSYFSKCFGQLFDMTPSQFIAAEKQKVP